MSQQENSIGWKGYLAVCLIIAALYGYSKLTGMTKNPADQPTVKNVAK